MSKVQMLRAVVKQRLTAAAEEIFGLFERTIAEYEEELGRSKEEKERQQRRLEAVFSDGDAPVKQVETIGDAYMVVGGVPVPTDSHAHRVANFALGMRIAAREVTNLVSGKPIQIRVGLHTGPVLARVVREKMPRYCLFGEHGLQGGESWSP